MHSFFVDKENISNDKITIIGEDVSHISRVLRLRCNDEILISDGECNEYFCSIESICKTQVICNILKRRLNKTESPLKITLFQGLPKSQKMDLIIQKCVEIGVYSIQPVITERVVVKVEYKDIKNKLDRWRRIALEAAKQSKRGIIPQVLEPVNFEDAISKLTQMDVSVVPYEREESRGLKSVIKDLKKIDDIGIFIGPEGGFSDIEIDECIKNSIFPVTLGPRIMRTETAGFVTSSIIQYELGDMGGDR